LRRLGSLHLAARKSLAGTQDVSAQLSLSMPLGALRIASAGASLNAGRRSVTTEIRKSLPAGPGLGYRLSASIGTVDRIEGLLSAQTAIGAHDAQLTWVDGKTGVRVSTTGGLGLVGRDAFASRRLSQSFATVKVGDYPNVRVYADNQLVGRTGRNGTLVVPRLRPFERNNLRIELADLPWDAQAPGDQLAVRPYNRHGVAVDFKVRAAHAAIIRVLLADRSPLPAGSIVVLDQGPEQFISAPGGEVYLTGLDAENWATASWPDGSCRFRFKFSLSDDPQPRLGDVRCAR
jgi:outer membrane usher protein